MVQNQTGNDATVENLIAQMSRGNSVLNDWDAVLNIDEDLVNQIFQAQFERSAQKDWKNIIFAFCQVFPTPQGSGKLALYTGVNITLATPSLKFLGDNQAFVEVSFKATGRTGTASQIVPADFDPKKDGNPDDPSLSWTYTGFSATDFTGTVPLSAVNGSPQTGAGMTQFVIDFPAGSFLSPLFNAVKDPDELQLRLKDYLTTHAVQYVINSITTDLEDQIPQMAPKAFRLAVLTTNTNRNVFQIFIATQNPVQRNLTVAVNEPIPNGFSLSVMFNQRIAGQLKDSLMVQAWLFMQSNLIFPGRSNLTLGPAFQPDDYLILGTLAIDMSSPDTPTDPKKDHPMLNIQKTMQITPSGQPAFTAYGDDQNTSLWYVPPKVVWAVNPDSGLPQLSLIKYNLTGGVVKGFCRLSAQLMVDPVQSAALQAAVPNAKIGQFDWISSSAVFTYTIAGKSTSIVGQPSNFGSQMVTFSVPLENDQAITAFINAFSNQGSASGTFGVSYELAAETRLPAVTVVSTFDSTIAYRYQVENKYRTETQYHTDTWGHTSSNNVSVFVGTYVHEMLQQSQAAKVTITPGQGLTPSLLNMVTDWANLQLQKDVEQAVNTALSLIKNPTNDFSMNSVAGFTHTLETSNVVPWYFEVQGTLPPINSQNWSRLYSVVNQQDLQVAFLIQEDLAKHGVDRINLTFQYGSGVPTVHTFQPTSQEPWNVTLPGIFEGSNFQSTYQYKYEVVYAAPTGGGTPPPTLSTGWITDNATVVAFGLAELGLMAVTFQASNIGWASTTPPAAGDPPAVQEITVDWNWVPGGNGPVLSESLVLKSGAPSATSTLRSTEPTKNQRYSYSLTFLMNDGTKLYAVGLSGSDPLCRIDHPLSEVSVSVFPDFAATPKAILLRATFDDEKNSIHLTKQWTVKNATDTFADWNFKSVVANLNMATIVFSGTWIDDKGKQHPLPKTIIVGTENTLILSDKERVVTAVIDASNVSFAPPKSDGVYRVVAMVASSPPNTPSTSGDNLANAQTLTFGQNQASIQYFSTNPINIKATPTFYYQYIYTVNKDNATHTEVTNNWTTTQSTVSTALPVVPGKPGSNLMRSANLRMTQPGEDARTKALFARHDSFCQTQEADLKLLTQ